MKLLGIDTGGTFTDFVYFENGTIQVHKVLSTPVNPAKAILQGMHDLGLDYNELKVIHGSTVATNAVLEGKGVKAAYVGNRGLKDVMFIGRQARESLYDLRPQQSKKRDRQSPFEPTDEVNLRQPVAVNNRHHNPVRRRSDDRPDPSQ